MAANASIQELIAQGANKSVRFWSHLNFSNPKKQLLSNDGVHLNQTGISRHWRSLRGAILYVECH